MIPAHALITDAVNPGLARDLLPEGQLTANPYGFHKGASLNPKPYNTGFSGPLHYDYKKEPQKIVVLAILVIQKAPILNPKPLQDLV